MLLYCDLHNHGIIPTSSTGVSAIMMKGGKTVHSALFIPRDIDLDTVPQLQYQSYRAQQIREAKILIIDEITMLNKRVFHMVDKTIRSVMPLGPLREEPFGGKSLVCSGDFKQLTVVEKGEQRPG